VSRIPVNYVMWPFKLSSLARNNSWVVEPRLKDCKAISCFCLFLSKDNSRYKAQLAAGGDSQKYEVDYSETFALVAKFTTIRLLPALGCKSNVGNSGQDCISQP